jgi:hypothetical protein
VTAHAADVASGVVRVNFVALVTGAIIALAGLDLLGTFFAAEWVARRSMLSLLAGLATFLALFLVYAASLRVADLVVVTFGWIVILQVGVVLLAVLRYGTHYSLDVWGVLVVLLGAQTYLIVRTG